ncbi:beta-N-acetylhexosaminidase [Limibacillus halophilus]|jgi:beta-N-acetylhexosaminidase
MKAVIFGLEGTQLNDWERAFFSEIQPTGFILFARNVETPSQLAALCQELCSLVDDPAAPILIDQEGGRVQRMGPPHWRKAPPAERFAQIYAEDRRGGERAAYLNAALMGLDLLDAGVTVDCAPVLDLRFPGAHDIIGDRSYGSDPEVVAALGRKVCEGLLSAGVLPIVKHIPGHGRALEDSHLALPRVTAGLDDLRRLDFAPFAALNDAPWAMTAHILYDALDPERPATQSQAVVTLIREELGFSGVIVSDDLSMEALGGSYRERAAKSLAAGCDLVLHCNGKPEEMIAVAEGSADLTPEARDRLLWGETLRKRSRQDLDRAALLAELSELLGVAAGAGA